MAVWGIDISNHQAGADLAKAKASGCGFVFAKATEGGTYRDAYFNGFRSTAARLGIPLGAYHFARPGNGRTGATEARFFLSVVGDVRPGELPCVLDIEDTQLSSPATVAWALEWLQTVHKATGVRPILYTYSGFAQAHLGGGRALAAYPLWLANYRTSTAVMPVAPSPWRSWHIWQHTSTARVAGIPGNCDRNITNLSTAQLKALGGSDAAPKEWDDMATQAEVQAAVAAAVKAAVSDIAAATALKTWQYRNKDAKYDAYGYLVTGADPAKLAAAVAPLLPQGAVSQDQLEVALRTVLGSVDNNPGA